jgi:hypothetical protein
VVLGVFARPGGFDRIAPWMSTGRWLN